MRIYAYEDFQSVSVLAVTGIRLPRASHAEFTTDHRGRTTLLRGLEPPALLALYARGFLLTNRSEIQFVYRAEGLLLAIRMERQRTRGEQHDHALVNANPLMLPRGVTPREIDVLTLVALGLPNAEIAGRLGTSPRTVTTQIERLLHKLEQRGRGGLAAIAVDASLLALPVPGGVEGVAPIAAVGLEQFAAALRSGRGASADPETTLASRHPIVIGTLAALSGIAADDGEEMVRGAALAIEEINANGGVAGRRLEHFVAGADLFDPSTVEAAMAQLVGAQVDAITTNYISAENPFLLETAADYGRPFLHLDTFQQHVDLVEARPDRFWMVYQTCPSEKYYALAFLRFLGELEASRRYEPANRRIAIVETDSASTRIAGEGFDQELAAIGWGVLARYAAPVRSTDWIKIARRICEAAPDVVLVAHYVPDEIATLHRLLVEGGFRGLVHYVYGASIPRFRDVLGPLADGAIWSSVTSRMDSDSATRFHRNYVMRYRAEPGPSQASSAYDQIQLLAWSWARNGSTVPRGTCKVLREDVYHGLNGIYYFGGGGQSPLSYPDGTSDPTIGQVLVTSQIQGGKSVVLSPPLFGSMARLQLPGHQDQEPQPRLDAD